MNGDQPMTAARARAICEDNDDIEGIARVVSEAPPLPPEAIAMLRAGGFPVLDEAEAS